MSVLDNTRKDFEALLSKQEFSNQSGSSEKESSRNAKRSRKKLLKKQKYKEEDTQPLELVQIKKAKHSASASSSDDGEAEAYVNQLFWYEEEKTASRSVSEKSARKSESSKKSVPSASGCSLNSEVSRKSAKLIKKGPSKEQASSTPTSQSSSERSLSESPISKVSSSKSKKSSRSLKSAVARSSSSKDSREERKSSIDKENDRLRNGQLKITVHYTDQLLFNHPNVKPMVVVHVVNRESGHYITNNGVPVPPQFSASWNEKDGTPQSSAPIWNQELQFPVDPSVSLENILVIFDVVSEPSNDQKCQLAWGFLRLVSRTGVKHLDKKIQVQLYRLPLRQLLHRVKATVTDLYGWYQSPQKEKYPSTLHITVRFESEVSGRESGLDGLAQPLNPELNLGSPLRRGRLNGQPFKLPTRRKFTFSSSGGSLVSSYSPDGKLLAFASTCGEISVHGAEAPLKLKGHLGNVYDLDWKCTNGDEPLLLSCGADCTARVWLKKSCIVLAHPTYVYGARFGPDDRIATGCFDQLIRLWEFNLKDNSVQLMGSYAKHTSSVNALCWNADGKLFSADACGAICVWSNGESDLHFERNLSCRNESVPINSLFLHPSGNRILAHYRGDDLCLLDARNGLKLVNYSGIYNHRLKLTSCITPCGSYVVSGSEDGSIYWFDLERGDLVAVMSFQSATTHPVPSVAFHPHDHVMAICFLCPELSVVLAEFNANDTQVQGFSLVTFPRTVQSAAHSNVNFTKVPGKLIIGSNLNTPTLDKLERIFKKLDLVMAWSQSSEKH